MIIHFMPSEIARLVLGYLKETDCKETAKLFVKESKHLTEYANGLKNGIYYSTDIGGKSLMDIINNFCCLQNRDNTNRCEDRSNPELNCLSKQLIKIETLLNKLIQNSGSGQNSCNNYRLIGSPPMMSTSSPIFVNTIDMNTIPIVSSQVSKSNQKETTLPNTPSRNGCNSPRRKRIPRRRVVSGSSPLKSLVNSSIDDSFDQTLVETSSDQLRDESEPQLKIDINEPLVQPEFIVEELINFEPLHDVLAENINKLFINSNNINENIHQNKESNKLTENSNQNLEPIEIRINDEVMNNILSNLETAPEFNTILDIITEKELQMTPYKNLSSVETTSSSASSLNTPQTPQIRVNAQNVVHDINPVVKNLMSDLRTPEKTLTLYAARSPSETKITPIKVTPVKVFRTGLGQDFNFVLNDTNLPIIVPKVSLIGQDFDLLANSIVNSGSTYSVSVQSNVNPASVNSCGASTVRKRMNKNVNFEKPASELQVKRSDLIHRKILPKPTNSGRPLTTTITPICADIDSVPKQSIVLVNNNLIPNQLNQRNRIDVKSDCLSPKQLLVKDQNGKRSNPDAVESSPLKIRASEIRFPTVNILRKMNVNKMDQFLKQIHSNKTND